MKTILGTLLALGLLSTAASAQWCPPGYGYRSATVISGVHAPTRSVMPAPIEPSAPAAAPIEPPAAPIEPAPLTPAPEAAPPK
jgi:hypothetical protein